LKDIKDTIKIRDCSNKSLQKDVNDMRTKYNDAIMHNSDIHQKLNEIRSQIITESIEIKMLQNTIDKLRKETCAV
jgi:SMC interacting uncharacterized protein involved in chromosome segregation